MFIKKASWILGLGGVAGLGVVAGLQWGSFTAQPTAPATEPRTPQPPTRVESAADPAIDVDRLAAQIGRELGGPLRLALQEELAAFLQTARLDASPGNPGEPGGPQASALTAGERESRQVAFADALRVVEDARLHGRFDSESRDDLIPLIEAMGPDQEFEVSRQLSAAINDGVIEIDDPEDLFF